MARTRITREVPDLKARPHSTVPESGFVDLWIRNPRSILDTALAEGVRQFTWQRGVVEKNKINIITHMRNKCRGFDVKYMLIGTEGTAEYNLVTSYTQPLAVYPTWRWGDDIDTLYNLVHNNVGDDLNITENFDIPDAVRPVRGQKHRIIIANMPPSNAARGKKAFSILDMLQENNPQCELFISGPGSFFVLFGKSFRACDYDPVWSAGSPRLVLPTGAVLMSPEEYALHKDWIELLGFKLSDMATRQGRIHMAFRSARWASRRWKYDYPVKRTYDPSIAETMEPTEIFMAPKSRTKSYRTKTTAKIKALAAGLINTRGDLMLCDKCVFQISCGTYRSESVCNRENTEMGELADNFGTRDPDKIITGLSRLLEVQAERAEKALDREEDNGETDPDVTRQLNSVFKNGAQLAKLLDPERLGGGTKINIGVGVASGATAITTVSMSNPKELMSAAVKSLEAYGIPRDKITTEMVTGLLKSMAAGTPREAIEGTVIKYEEGSK